MSNILSKLFDILTYIVFAIIFLLYLVTNNYIWLILYLLFTFLICKNEKIKHFSVLLFVTSFLVRLIVILCFNIPQVYDFKILLDASKLFSKGDYSFNEWWHFKTWSYQTGFVIYQGLVLKIINNELILKLLTDLYSSSLVVIIYKLSKRISNEKASKIVSLLYMVFPYHIWMNVVLVNHHLSAFLMYIGILFLLKENKRVRDYIISGILISLGNIIRPEGIIVVFTLIVYEILTLDKEKLKKTLICVSSFILVYFLVGTTSSFIIMKTNINPNGLSNKDPMWKFVLGFNHDTCGFYNKEDDELIYSKKIDEKELIKERVLNKKTPKLLTCKVRTFWLDSGLHLEEGSFYNKEIKGIKMSTISNIVMRFNQTIQTFIVVMVILGLFVKRKNIKREHLFLLILSITTFCIYLLIEIQGRYAYFITISMFIMASTGIEYILNKIEKGNH